MTQNLSAAQQTQLENRDSSGRFQQKTHADVDDTSGVLGIDSPGQPQPPYSEDNHTALGNRLADELGMQGYSSGSWYADHNEESKVSYVRSADTDLEFSIGAEEHLSPGKIALDSESPEDGHDLAGPHAWEGEINADFVSSARSSYDAKTYDEALQWADGKISARLANDAWEDQMDPESEHLDALAKREGEMVLGGMHRWSSGEASPSEHLESHTAFSDEFFTEDGYDDSAVIDYYGNSQQVYFGDGDPTDYVSTHFVVGVDADGAFDSEASGGYRVVHSVSANGHTYAHEGSWEIVTPTNVSATQASEYARAAAQQDHVNANVGAAHPDHELLATPSEAKMLAMDINHTDGKLLLARADEYDGSRHHLRWQSQYDDEDADGDNAWTKDL